MEQVIYKPYMRRQYLKIMALTTVCCLVLSCIGYRRKELALYLLLILFEMIEMLSFRGSVVMDAEGIHCVFPNKGEVVSVSWEKIIWCRFVRGGYGTPSICILFQNSEYTIYGKRMRNTDTGIRMGREGRKVLCDLSLRSIYWGFAPTKEFSKRDVFGVVVTEEEYRQIQKWWLEWNNVVAFYLISETER